MNWLVLFGQAPPLPTTPDAIVRGVNEGGALWLLAALCLGLVMLGLWLGRSLLAKNEQIALLHADYGKQLQSQEKAHGQEVAAMYKSQLEVAEETKTLLVKLNEKLNTGTTP